MYDAPAQVDEEEDLETRVLRYLATPQIALTERELARNLHMTKELDRKILESALIRMAGDGLIEQVKRKSKRGPSPKGWCRTKSA